MNKCDGVPESCRLRFFFTKIIQKLYEKFPIYDVECEASRCKWGSYSPSLVFSSPASLFCKINSHLNPDSLKFTCRIFIFSIYCSCSSSCVPVSRTDEDGIFNVLKFAAQIKVIVARKWDCKQKKSTEIDHFENIKINMISKVILSSFSRIYCVFN